MQLPKPTHTRNECERISLWIADGGPCPACKQRWVRFPEFQELLHRGDCTFLQSLNHFAVVDEAVALVLAS